MPPDRTSRLVRLLTGLWQVPSAVAYLLRRPSLWPMCILPIVFTIGLALSGLVAAHLIATSILDESLPDGARWYRFLTATFAFAGSYIVGTLLGITLALPVVAYLSERLSLRVEMQLRSAVVAANHGVHWELTQAFWSAIYFFVRFPAALLVGLIPIVGPGCGLLWAAHCLSFQQTDATLGRHGLDFSSRRAWHRRHRFESLGFGLAGIAFLLVPVANFFLIPSLVVGGTRLALRGLEIRSNSNTSADPATLLTQG